MAHIKIVNYLCYVSVYCFDCHLKGNSTIAQQHNGTIARNARVTALVPDSLQLAPNILVTHAVSYPSQATGVSATNLVIRQTEAMESRTPLFSLPPVRSSSCVTGLNARFIKTQKKSPHRVSKVHDF